MRPGRAKPALPRSLLQCDEDDAVRAARSVHRGGAGVLEHLDPLDVLRVHVEEQAARAGELVAVDDDQRIAVAEEGAGAADAKGEPPRAADDLEAGDASRDELLPARHRRPGVALAHAAHAGGGMRAVLAPVAEVDGVAFVNRSRLGAG